ncbi:MAG: sigma-70 family RNA polymerase sigma factor [Armatimonadota bacterium]|nr:sigma-70 family RNA polymerase sigma factor [Armatimonadota bacterium]
MYAKRLIPKTEETLSESHDPIAIPPILKFSGQDPPEDGSGFFVPAAEGAGSQAERDPRAASPAAPLAEPLCFEAAVERYHGKVFQLTYRYTGDYDAACDLTQDTFVCAHRAWSSFRGDSHVYIWLYRIATNLCHNYQRKLSRRQRWEQYSVDDCSEHDGSGARTAREPVDDCPLPPQTLENRELGVRLQEALLDLPESYRTVLVLHEIEGLTYQEIAAIMHDSLQSIKSRLWRARQALRRLLEPYLQSANRL